MTAYIGTMFVLQILTCLMELYKINQKDGSGSWLQLVITTAFVACGGVLLFN
jgi:hypothetical protein